MDKKIVFTGGGTAGHVTPNIALIEALQADDWKIDYIGSIDGIEKSMINAINVPYHAVRCGKLRRYFSWKNFYDPFNLQIGILQSIRLLRKIKPNIVFSKGGFVALPVVIAAWLTRTPVIAHESDMSPGLANRLSFPFVDKICVTFAAEKHIGQVVEGKYNAAQICALASQHGVDMPICNAVNSLLLGQVTAEQAVINLMQRPPRDN